MNNSSLPLRTIFCLVTVSALLLSPLSASAQLFSPLGPSSKYSCIKFPSGKFGVGLATRTGYDSKEFSAVNRDLSRKLSNARTALKGKRRVFSEYVEDQQLAKSEVTQALAGVPGSGVSKGVSQRLNKLNEGIKKANESVVRLTAELRALEDCQKGKTNFDLNFSSSSAKLLTRNALEIILTIGIELPYAGTYPSSFSALFCRRKEGDSGRYQFTRAVKNPCGEATTNGVFDDCFAPKDLLYIPLAVTHITANASDTLINSSLEALEKDYGGVYSIKSIGDSPNDPCGYLTK